LRLIPVSRSIGAPLIARIFAALAVTVHNASSLTSFAVTKAAENPARRRDGRRRLR
jgi:hypothetical protein